jgi:hypothetical protein
VIPSVFAPARTLPLVSRLSEAEVAAQAVTVDRLQVLHDDPRLVEPDAMLAVLSTAPRALCLWPDQTLAWATFAPGTSVAHALRAAYEQGRAQLEQIHLLHDQPAGLAA